MGERADRILKYRAPGRLYGTEETVSAGATVLMRGCMEDAMFRRGDKR